MKLKLTNTLFAFIITTILFSCFIQFATAQKATGYPCRCGTHTYGCGPTDSKCVAYCASRCRIADSTEEISSKDSPVFIPVIILPSGSDASKLFENEEYFITLPFNAETGFYMKWNWALLPAQ
jgi:hypothetical protein